MNPAPNKNHPHTLASRSRLSVAALVLSLLFYSAPALADGDVAGQNLERFAQIAGVVQGFSSRGEIWRGELVVGESTLITEQLHFGNEYLVIAAGDDDTVSLRLE
ncbi:MAG: hypothetical protein KC561_18070, partial [Myxococcales bacterium]|nr:hypothetical protein [Myxococcales bacterium]